MVGMKIVRQIIQFFILVFLFIIIAHGENFPEIDKTSTITLLNDGVIRVETHYRLDPRIDTFITSEAINSSGKLSNISIRINSEEIPENEYLFSLDDVPGNDSGRLLEFLKHRYSIDWVETAEIDKIDDGRTIRVYNEVNFLSLKLNNEKTKINLKIDDGRTEEYNAKTENDKLNIYENEYGEYIRGTLRFVALNKSLSYYADFDDPKEIDIKYETNLPYYDIIKIELVGLSQRTDTQTEVNYMLKLHSSNDYFHPIASGTQDGFSVTNYVSGDVELTKNYKTILIDSGKTNIQFIDDLYFVNKTLILVRDYSRTFDINVNSNLVKVIYNIKDNGMKGQPTTQRFMEYSLPEDVTLAENPKIKIITDKEEYSLKRIEYGQFTEGQKKGFTKPFYYFGKGQNSNNNTLYIGYNLPEDSDAEIVIEIQFEANKVLTSEDGFNYVFNYNLTFPLQHYGYIEFLTFDISKGGFTVDDTNFQSNLITKKFKNSDTLKFKFENVDSEISPLEIKFSSIETKKYNNLVIANYFLLLLAIFIIIIRLNIFNIIYFKNSNIKKIGSQFIFIINNNIKSLSIFIIGLDIGSFSVISFDIIIYTKTWIPILIVAGKEIYERIISIKAEKEI